MNSYALRNSFLGRRLIHWFHLMALGVLRTRTKLSVSFKARVELWDNFIYTTEEIEGRRPIVVVPDDSLGEVQVFISLRKLCRKIPFWAELLVLTEDDSKKYSRLVSSRHIRDLRALQKLVFLSNSIQKNPAPKLWRSVDALLLEFEEECIETLQSLHEAIVRVLETEAEKFCLHFNFPEEKHADVSNFRIEMFPLHVTKGSVWGIPVSKRARNFWSMTAPGVYVTDGTPSGRNDIFFASWQAAVAFEGVVQLAESRGGRLVSAWLAKDNEDLTHLKQIRQHQYVPEGHDVAQVAPFCDRPFRLAVVNSNGAVSNCCWQASTKANIGNLTEQSFEEIWSSPTVQQVRQEILDGKMPRLCAISEGCPSHRTSLWKSNAPLSAAKPELLEVNLPNYHCNIGGNRPSEKTPACIMCERSEPDYEFEDGKDYERVLDNLKPLMPTAKLLHIQGVAEPFWKDEIFRVLDKLEFDKYRDQIVVTSTTNGTIFTPERQLRFLERCPRSFVGLSIDAGSSETFQKIRRLDMYEKVLENARAYGKNRRKDGTSGFMIKNNINLLNINDVEEMVRFAAECGADLIELNPTDVRPAGYLVNESNAHLFLDAHQKAEAEAKRVGIPITFLRPLDKGLARARVMNV